ncbi:MAG: enoyl-CoA hydratase [Mycobacteriaceae bacterium]
MIKVARNEQVVTITFQREERRNALNTELCQAVTAGIADAIATDTRVIVLTGQGSSFCAGADLGGEAHAAHFHEALKEMLQAIEYAPVPIIAAVNGPAMGAGVQVCLASDLRVVAAEAKFAIPAAALGIAVDNWTIKRLVTLVGGGRARAMMLSAEPISAAEALTAGFANKIGDLELAQQWAQKISMLAPLALRHSKIVLNDDHAHDEPTVEHLAAQKAAWSSADIVEAALARKEKRPPQFTGN